MLHGLLEVGDVVFVDLGDGLVVLGRDVEPAHVRVDVHGADEAVGGLCNKEKKGFGSNLGWRRTVSGFELKI